MYKSENGNNAGRRFTLNFKFHARNMRNIGEQSFSQVVYQQESWTDLPSKESEPNLEKSVLRGKGLNSKLGSESDLEDSVF